MAQDTRKDPRAKVLTMTVRYKSATLDEFIEHHSHDVSRGGMFIKTPSPFPPGTLLKFEVKIAEDQKVMQGVGRVVWKREPSESADDRPAGMGVKFIKIDEESTRVIDQLVKSRGDGKAAFEAGEEPAVPAPSRPPAVKPVEPLKAPEPLKPAAAAPAVPLMPQRKATMIGLGGLGKSEPAAPEPQPKSVPRPEPERKQASFFPKTESEKDMPPPEDRTVMKQAAELLQDALREAGGSMDDVGVAPTVPPPSAEPEKKETSPALDELSSSADAPSEETPKSERPTPAVIAKAPEPAPESGRADRLEKSDRIEKKVEKERAAAPARAVKEEPSSRRPIALTPAAASEAREGGGGGKAIALLLGVAAAAAAVFFLTRQDPKDTPPAAPPEPTTEEQAREQPAPPEPAPVATEPPAATDAAAAVEPAATAETPKEDPKPDPPQPKIEPPPPPKPTAAPPPPKPTATAPQPTPTATEAPTAEPQPKPEPKPKPPKPKPPPSDNPY
jgi:uncharacterized protein (TIGR02266 family)